MKRTTENKNKNNNHSDEDDDDKYNNKTQNKLITLIGIPVQ